MSLQGNKTIGQNFGWCCLQNSQGIGKSLHVCFALKKLFLDEDKINTIGFIEDNNQEIFKHLPVEHGGKMTDRQPINKSITLFVAYHIPKKSKFSSIMLRLHFFSRQQNSIQRIHRRKFCSNQVPVTTTAPEGLEPEQISRKLSEWIVGQEDAKKSVAVAIRMSFQMPSTSNFI